MRITIGQSCRTGVAARLLAFALIVAGYLFVCRWLIVYYAHAPSDLLSAEIFVGAIHSFGMDGLAVATVLTAALVVARLSAAAATILMVVACAYLMIAGAVNVRIMDVYQQPATVNLLSYGDFLNVAGLRSLTRYMTRVDTALIVSALACLAAFAFVGRLLAWAGMSRLLVGVALALLVALSFYGLASASDEDRRRHANAGWWLLKSAFASGAPARIANPDLGDPFETYVAGEESRVTTPERVRRADIHNVVIIVLELVGSEYLDLRRNPRLTPQLRLLQSKSAYFPNAMRRCRVRRLRCSA